MKIAATTANSNATHIMAALVIIAGFFIVLFPYNPAHAYTGNILWNNGSSTSTCGTTWTITVSQNPTAGDAIFFSFFGATNTSVITGITDNLGNSWVATKGALYQELGITDEWYVPSSVGGSLTTITVSFSGTQTFCTAGIVQYDIGAAGLVPNSLVSSAAGYLGASSSSCSTPSPTTNYGLSGYGGYTTQGAVACQTATYGSGLSLSAGQIFVGEVFAYSRTTSDVNPYQASPLVEASGESSQTDFHGYQVVSQYFSSGSHTVKVQTLGQTVSSGAQYVFGVAGYVFNSQGFSYLKYGGVGAATSFGAVVCNSTTTALTQHNMYWQTYQASGGGATISNVSLWLSSVGTATVQISIGVYVASTSNVQSPSGPNPFTLLYYTNLQVPVSASAVHLSVLPDINAGAFDWFIVGFAQTDSGTGTVSAKVAALSVKTNTQTAFATGNLPTTISAPASSSSTNHSACLSGVYVNNPLYITQPSLTTTTVTQSFAGGGATTTQTYTLTAFTTSSITQTFTSTQLYNSPNMSATDFWLMPALFLASFLGLGMVIVSISRRTQG